MADGDGDIFVYLGGEQRVPRHVVHAVIDPSVKIVRAGAFAYRRQLVSVVFHDGVGIIEHDAFRECESLRRLKKLVGVREIGDRAFQNCVALRVTEFGDNLETVGDSSFFGCDFLSRIKMPTARNIQDWAFGRCYRLTGAEFGVNLERIGFKAFGDCPNLYSISIPLKYDLFPFDRNINYQRRNQFDDCRNLRVVDIVGAEDIHKTISSFHMESWKDEMNVEIDRIDLYHCPIKANRIHNGFDQSSIKWTTTNLSTVDI